MEFDEEIKFLCGTDPQCDFENGLFYFAKMVQRSSSTAIYPLTSNPKKLWHYLRQQSEQLENKNMQTEASASQLTWMLPLEKGGIRPVQSTFKIRKLKTPTAKNPDIVTKLRNTWFGWVYD